MPRYGHRGYAAAESTERVLERPNTVRVCTREREEKRPGLEGHAAPGQEDTSLVNVASTGRTFTDHRELVEQLEKHKQRGVSGGSEGGGRGVGWLGKQHAPPARVSRVNLLG